MEPGEVVNLIGVGAALDVLETLQREIRNRLGAGTSRMTRLHLQDSLARIESILDPEE